MNQKKYEKAIDNFSYIRDNYPFDPIAFVATVKLGDVYFLKKEYILAVGVYEDFFSVHPEDENIPYVLLKIAECYEHLSLTFDRDQNYTLKAIDRLTFLRNRFPASEYVTIADIKLKKLNQKLADREVYVGEFYFKTYQYNASIIRLEYFLKKYPDARGRDKALYYLSASNKALGNVLASEQYFVKLQEEFPKSTYARWEKRERKTLKLASAGQPFSTGEMRRREIDLRPQMVAQVQPQVQPQTETVAKDEDDDDISFFDTGKPIDIVSDTMEGFDQEKYIIFKGSVIARQEDLFIFADTIEATMDEETNEIEKAHARGNVKIVKKERTATCNEAIFDNTQGEIILKENVIVYSEQDKLTGQLVTYYVEEDRVVVEGEKEKKARVIITPK